ncbi:hypothetical protein [Paracoccus sp. S1E-3]|uniref:hypothetical protein n=1 Tax=Paracoccus sp. S1E-3 TaxID=2756130 RepID=UPI0015EF0131|nr:hypothetical protein [Paracoccus sp. S1E-3]MBA4489586.1 hypothetical protein [Paracoccus sp. S1E-3]
MTGKWRRENDKKPRIRTTPKPAYASRPAAFPSRFFEGRHIHLNRPIAPVRTGRPTTGQARVSSSLEQIRPIRVKLRQYPLVHLRIDRTAFFRGGNFAQANCHFQLAEKGGLHRAHIRELWRKVHHEQECDDPALLGWLPISMQRDCLSPRSPTIAQIARKLRISDASVRSHLRREAENRERLRAEAERRQRSAITPRNHA